jgi:hypothetical protein
VEVFRQPHNDDEYQIDNEALNDVEVTRLTVQHRKGDEEEEVGHFADGHALRAVTDDAKDGKESEGGTYHSGVGDGSYDFSTHEQVDEHEDAYREQDECEVVITALPLGEVEEMDD